MSGTRLRSRIVIDKEHRCVTVRRRISSAVGALVAVSVVGAAMPGDARPVEADDLGRAETPPSTVAVESPEVEACVLRIVEVFNRGDPMEVYLEFGSLSGVPDQLIRIESQRLSDAYQLGLDEANRIAIAAFRELCQSDEHLRRVVLGDGTSGATIDSGVTTDTANDPESVAPVDGSQPAATSCLSLWSCSTRWPRATTRN